jgi:GNAT acetyltransferase-like protein
VEIGPWSAADADALFTIYARIFGDQAGAARRASWTWQYQHNPQSREPIVWVARDAQRPLGQLGTMPVSLWWAGNEVRASWGVDYFVAPDREGLGYSIELVRTWMQRVDVALAVGLAPASYLICKRLGFRDLGYVPYFEAVLDPSAIARRRWGAIAGAIAAPLKPARRLIMRSPRPRGLEVVPASLEPSAYDAFWETSRHGYAACVRRDAAYVSWKYGSAPHKEYRIVEARRAAALAGFAVSRVENYRGLRIGWIVDLFTATDDQPARDALLTDVMNDFDRQGVARAQAFALHAPLAADLRRHGFFSRPSRSHLCVRPNGIGDDPLGAPDKWHIVFGDGDSDR